MKFTLTIAIALAPLVASSAIDRRGFFSRLKDGFEDIGNGIQSGIVTAGNAFGGALVDGIDSANAKLQGEDV